jgi:hypothetical protein
MILVIEAMTLVRAFYACCKYTPQRQKNNKAAKTMEKVLVIRPKGQTDLMKPLAFDFSCRAWLVD